MSGRYTKEQVIQLCRNLLSASDEYQSKVDQFGRVKVGLLPWVQQAGSWGWVYNRPWQQLLTEMCDLMGLEAQSLLPASSELDHGLLDGRVTDRFDEIEVPEGHEGFLMLMIMAWQGQLRAFDLYNRSIDQLLAEVRAGDDEALFKAVRVDPAVLGAFTAQSRLAQAALVGDQAFFDSLAKALTGAKPRRPKADYDPIRDLYGTLEDLGALEGLTQDELCEIFIDHLGLYPHDSDDPYAGLKKLFRQVRSP